MSRSNKLQEMPIDNVAGKISDFASDIKTQQFLE
jgi:hypothetical protein